MSRAILCVGKTCIDMVCVCQTYPIEDSDNRCLEQYLCRGGNASNNSSVLAVLGDDVACLSYLKRKDHFCDFIIDDFASFGIDVRHIRYYDEDGVSQAPIGVATCILSRSTGTRTISFHGKGAPEVGPAQFESVDRSRFGWIHFEGRYNWAEILEIIRSIREAEADRTEAERTIVSVEVEKARAEIPDDLVSVGDVVFVSKARAAFKGFADRESAARGFAASLAPGAVVVVPWGDIGAAAAFKDSDHLVLVDAYRPAGGVVDTLGAGDTFVAAVVHRLNRARLGPGRGGGGGGGVRFSPAEVEEALKFAAWIAGEKCGVYGFAGFRKWYRENGNKDWIEEKG